MGLRGNAGLEQESPSSPNIFGATTVGPDPVTTSEMWCYKSCLVQGSHRDGQDPLELVWGLCGHWSRNTAVSGRQWGRGSSQFPHGSPNKCFLPDATTAFVGQCFVDAGGKEILSTTWLLREAVGSLEEDWKATR